MDNLLGSRKLPQVELSEDELTALSDLGKVDAKKGLSYNPYSNIDPEFLKIKDDDDDDWLYLTVSTNRKSVLEEPPKNCSFDPAVFL